MSEASELRKLHKVADKLEARVQRKFLSAVLKVQKEVDVDKLAMALANGNVDNVMKLIPPINLGFLTDSIFDGFDKGGEYGAKQINGLRNKT